MAVVTDIVGLKPDQIEIRVSSDDAKGSREIAASDVAAILAAFGALFEVSETLFAPQAIPSAQAPAPRFILVVDSVRRGSALIILQAIPLTVALLAGDAATAIANFYAIIQAFHQIGWRSQKAVAIIQNLSHSTPRTSDLERMIDKLGNTMERVDRVEIRTSNGDFLIIDGAKFRKNL